MKKQFSNILQCTMKKTFISATKKPLLSITHYASKISLSSNNKPYINNRLLKFNQTKDFTQTNSSSISHYQSLNKKELIRNPNFKTITKSDVDFFNNIIGKNQVLSAFNDTSLTKTDFSHFNIDYMKIYEGRSQVVLFPNNINQISEIMKYCNKNKIAVVPQSGNTGLVGGSTPVFDEIVISMLKFNKIISFDELTNTIHCEAGVVLENLNKYLEEKGHTPPVDLGAKGSCLIGGNIATNAGGIHFIKYGSLRKNVKGLKAVLATGEIIDNMNPLPKNNTGYDLKQMFCGSEGTLGIITECILNTYKIPKYKSLALLKFNKFEDILELYKNAKDEFCDMIYGLEFFDTQSMYLQVKYNNQKNPFNERNENTDSKFIILLV